MILDISEFRRRVRRKIQKIERCEESIERLQVSLSIRASGDPELQFAMSNRRNRHIARAKPSESCEYGSRRAFDDVDAGIRVEEILHGECLIERFPFSLDSLIAFAHEVVREHLRRIEHRLPGIVLWRENDRPSDPVDIDRIPLEAKFLRQSHGLALAVFEQLGALHEAKYILLSIDVKPRDKRILRNARHRIGSLHLC